jgi:hypothetical protein
MSERQEPTLRSAPVSNYGAAVARALEWLGDRYLLAKPINAPTRPPRLGDRRSATQQFASQVTR